MNENLHRQLVDACERYVMIEKYGQAIDSIETENARLYDDYEKTKRKGFSAVSGVLLLIFGGIFLWFALVFAGALLSAVLESPIIMMLMYVVAIGLAFLIPVFPIMYKLTFCRSKNKKIDQENSKYFQEKYLPLMEKNDDNIANLEKERDAFISGSQHFLDFLPEAYKTPLAVAFMENAVRSGRADTLKEALNLFEEQLHRWTLENQGQRLLEQNAIQAQMLNDHLGSIESNQRRIASSLQNIEALEFYNTFCR